METRTTKHISILAFSSQYWQWWPWEWFFCFCL